MVKKSQDNKEQQAAGQEDRQKSQEATAPQEAIAEKEAEAAAEEKEEPAAEPALNDKVAELEQQQQDLRDKHLRLLAEFDNFKKRNARERLELINSAGADIIASLLPVLDDFDRALKTLEEAKDVASIEEGIRLIYNKLKSQLTQKGLREMEAQGEPFDPDYHDALTEVPAPKKALKGKVVEEVEKGYFLNNKILRHAKVVVGK